MAFIKNALFATLSIAAICSSMLFGDQYDSGSPYKRIITTIHERADTPQNFVDPNHQLMIATGLYNQADANLITAKAIAQFYATYGIDFGSAAPDANGIRTIAGVGIMIPYIDGLEEDILLVTDSNHPERAASGEWFSLQVGQAVVFTGSGAFSGGINAGATYNAGDNWVLVNYNLLKSDSNWHKHQNREEFEVCTYEIGERLLSQWSKPEILLSLNITDKHNHQGFGVSGSVDVKRPEGTGPFFVTVTDTFFWHKN